MIKKVKNTVPWTDVIGDLKGEETVGKFTKKNCKKTNQKVSSVEKANNPHMHKMGPLRPKHYSFGNHFAQRNPESSGSMYSFFLLEVDRIHKEL